VIPPKSEAGAERSKIRDAFARAFFANLARHVVDVRERRTTQLEITPSPRAPGEFAEGSWTLAVLPDTQVYALRYPGLFTMQTAWIRQNRERLDIRYVLQLGDIVNNNTPREWRNAREAFRVLDGVVPYALVPGNHDYGPSGDASTRETLLNDSFPFDEISGWPTFGGARVEGRLDNTYHLFRAGGVDWIVLALEWAPTNETVRWANRVMKEHEGRRGILITHAYLNNNDRRYDHTDREHPQDYNPHHYRTPGPVNDGEELWQKLVKRHDFALVLNGHVLGDGTGYLASKNDAGSTVHQILANYQMRELGGEGYLRLLEFRPDGRTVRVKSYSPLHDRYLLDPDQHFGLELD
jgi:3',5'-cyclic AMP phosphodiesterase CpdA